MCLIEFFGFEKFSGLCVGVVVVIIRISIELNFCKMFCCFLLWVGYKGAKPYELEMKLTRMIS